ncbi:MAG: hypothetical protein QM831_28550 [Kofleriaceae bacterium]
MSKKLGGAVLLVAIVAGVWFLFVRKHHVPVKAPDKATQYQAPAQQGGKPAMGFGASEFDEDKDGPLQLEGEVVTN